MIGSSGRRHRIPPKHRMAIVRTLTAKTRRFIHDDSGATMVEYSVMVALIAAVCVLAISVVGNQTQGLFSTVSAAWTAA